MGIPFPEISRSVNSQLKSVSPLTNEKRKADERDYA